MRPLLVLAAVMILTPAVALADTRPPLGATVDVTMGGGLHRGEVGEHAASLTPFMRAGAGISRGRVAFVLSFSFSMLRELEEPPTAYRPEFIELGVEPSVRYELTRGAGLRSYLRAGWRWRWVSTDALYRTCDFHGGCDGGYYIDEDPTYPAHGPVAAVGVGLRTKGDYWAGFGLELAVGHATLRRPGMDPDLGDTLVTFGMNVALGRAP